MARQTIDVGKQGNDGTGDTIREAFKKININFDELYSGYTNNTTVLDISPSSTTAVDLSTYTLPHIISVGSIIDGLILPNPTTSAGLELIIVNRTGSPLPIITLAFDIAANEGATFVCDGFNWYKI